MTTQKTIPLGRIGRRPTNEKRPKLCYCQLSGHVHVIINNEVCEVHQRDNEILFGPHNVRKVLEYYHKLVDKLSKEVEQIHATNSAKVRE